MLDTILRSHSQTLVLEEKPYLLNVRHNYFKKNNISELLNLNENYKIEIQKQYFNSFNYDPNKITIDKFPLNLLELGFKLINCIFNLTDEENNKELETLFKNITFETTVESEPSTGDDDVETYEGFDANNDNDTNTNHDASNEEYGFGNDVEV